MKIQKSKKAKYRVGKAESIARFHRIRKHPEDYTLTLVIKMTSAVGRSLDIKRARPTPVYVFTPGKGYPHDPCTLAA